MIEPLGGPPPGSFPEGEGAKAQEEWSRVTIDQEEPHGRDFGDRADAFSTADRQR
jgi:hypothetical protein